MTWIHTFIWRENTCNPWTTKAMCQLVEEHPQVKALGKLIVDLEMHRPSWCYQAAQTEWKERPKVIKSAVNNTYGWEGVFSRKGCHFVLDFGPLLVWDGILEFVSHWLCQCCMIPEGSRDILVWVKLDRFHWTGSSWEPPPLTNSTLQIVSDFDPLPFEPFYSLDRLRSAYGRGTWWT